MSEISIRHIDAEKAIVHDRLPLGVEPRDHIDRTFGLPTGLYVASAAGYLGFVGILCLTLASPGLAIPGVIFAFFIVAAFGVAGMWARMQPDNPSRPLSMGRFMSHGIDTFTGRMSGRSAVVQVMILPALIFFWSVAVATLWALLA